MAEACGAKTRSGKPCKVKAMPNGRCRMHGGTNTGAPTGNTNAVTHGIYAKHLTKAEAEAFPHIELGTVDEEIRLTRIRLARALAAENKAKGKPELEEVTKNEGGGAAVPKVSRKSIVRDYTSTIDRLTGRIESLEKTRQLLIADGEGAGGSEIVGFEVVPYEDTPQ